MTKEDEIKPIIPNKGIIIYEEKPFFILCKPKLLPLKSFTLEKLEKIEKNAQAQAKKDLDAKSA